MSCMISSNASSSKTKWKPEIWSVRLWRQNFPTWLGHCVLLYTFGSQSRWSLGTDEDEIRPTICAWSIAYMTAESSSWTIGCSRKTQGSNNADVLYCATKRAILPHPDWSRTSLYYPPRTSVCLDAHRRTVWHSQRPETRASQFHWVFSALSADSALTRSAWRRLRRLLIQQE